MIQSFLKFFTKAGAAVTIGASIFTSCSSPGYTPGKLAGAPVEEELPVQKRENFFQVTEDVSLYYETAGRGEKTALVLHGGPGYPHRGIWEGLASLEDDYRFIYYHQRGCGNSSRPAALFESKNYYKNMVSLIDQLGISAHLMDIERIRRITGKEKITLIGHSFGGFLAALYAAEFPDRVDKLLLIAPAEVVVMDPKQSGGLYDHIASRLPDDMKSEFGEYMKRFFDYGSIFNKTEEELSRLNAEFNRYYAAAAGSRGIEEEEYAPGEIGGFMMHGIYFSMGQKHDYTEALRKIEAPALIVAGNADFGISIDAIKDQYTAVIPDAELIQISGATHFMMGEPEGPFSRTAKGFLVK